MKTNKKQPTHILVGSRAFFAGLPEFKSKDVDYVKIVSGNAPFNFVRQTSTGGMCLYEWKRLAPQEYIDYALTKGAAMQLGKFLVPDFVNAVGFTIEHLAQLAPLTEQLDPKHQYEKIIFDAYIANGDFVLTDEQRAEAYESYKSARPTKTEKQGNKETE